MELVEKCSLLWAMASEKLSGLNFRPVLELCILVVTVFFIYCEKLVRLVLPAKKKSMNGQVILVTGSAGGLGQEICKQLVTSGAKLVLWDVCTQANLETAQQLRQLGATHVFEDTVDITDRNQVQKAAEKVRSTVGPVTILVNNAGMAHINHFLELSPASIQKTFDVNVISQFWTIQEFLPNMIKSGGHIVTVASTMSHLSMRGSAPYYASKHAVHALIECLKDELADKAIDNVKFTTAYPFFIKTNLIRESEIYLKFKFPSLTPFLEVSDVAERIIHGIEYEKEFVYVPRTFQIYMILKPFLPTKVHREIISFFIEELKILPTIASDKNEEVVEKQAKKHD